MKKLFTFFAVCLMAASISAQNFMKFDAVDINGVKALHGIAHRTGASQLDILVPENFDVANVNVDWNISATDEMLTSPFPTDFTSPQTISVKSPTNTKNWTVTFKKVKPAALPLDLTFSADFPTNSWDGNTLGWAGAALDPADKNSSVVRFATVTTTFITAFTDAPGKVSFTMKALAAFGEGVFDVLSSEDGITWKSEMQMNSENAVPQADTEYSFTPLSNVRYVKWVYTKRVANMTMNNITIEKATSTVIEESAVTPNVYVNGNELVVAAEINKVEVYNVAGAQALVANNPSTSIDLSGLAKGIYVAKATTENATKTIKFIIK